MDGGFLVIKNNVYLYKIAMNRKKVKVIFNNNQKISKDYLLRKINLALEERHGITLDKIAVSIEFEEKQIDYDGLESLYIDIEDLRNLSVQEEVRKALNLGCKIFIKGKENDETLVALSEFIGEQTEFLQNINVENIVRNGTLDIEYDKKKLKKYDIFKNNRFVNYDRTIFINDDSKINVEFISKLLQTQKLFGNMHFIISSHNPPIEIAIFNGRVIIDSHSKERGSKIELPDNIKKIVQMLIDDKEKSYTFYAGEELIDEVKEMGPKKLHLSSKDILFKVAQICKAGGETKLEQVAIAYEWLIRNSTYDRIAAKRLKRYLKISEMYIKKAELSSFFDKFDILKRKCNNIRICNKIDGIIQKYREKYRVSEKDERKIDLINSRASERLITPARSLEGIQDSKLICSGFSNVLCEILENMRNRM